MTDFDYSPTPGIYVDWILHISGYPDGDELNGDLEQALRRLSDVEEAIEDLTDEYAEGEGVYPSRVRGSHGWREYTWTNGAVHRYEWRMVTMDMRCAKCVSPDNDLYMVTDEVWEQAGLAYDAGWVCFRCVEGLLGRQLTPGDFMPDLPANTDEIRHCEDLRQRIGLA